MAYQDNTNALQLHIEINSENLLPVPQKYNAGSLRIPADPSWPKIPQRKLTNGDTIEPPYIVKLTGTPRRSHTVIQTPLNQSPKSSITKDSAYSSFHHQKTGSNIYSLRRFPGYVDPRFKNRVTNIKKNQVTSTESLQKKMDQSNITTFTEHLHREEVEKLVPEKEQIKIEEAQHPHKKKEIESIRNYKENNMFYNNKELFLERTHSTNNSELKRQDYVSETDNKKETTEHIKNAHSSEHISKSTVNDANTQVDITCLPVQENNGQLLFVLDKKLQSRPINSIQIDTVTIPQEYMNQCYNVQLPVLTYQNIPMQVSTTGPNIIQQCLHHSEYKNQTKTLIKKESEQHIHLNQAQNKNSFTNAGKKNIHEKKTALMTQNSVLEQNKKSCLEPNFSENSTIFGKLLDSNIQQKQQESSDSEYYIPNINKKDVHNNVSQCLKMKKVTCNISGEETIDSEVITKNIVLNKEFMDINESIPKKINNINTDAVHDNIKTLNQSHNQINYLSKNNEYPQPIPQSNVTVTDQDQSLYQNYKIGIYETKGKNKSEQYLFSTKSERTRKLCHNSEPYITLKQRKGSAKFVRKAKSYFQKNSHSALVDSDYTLIWPNCQYNKYKRNHTNIHKLCNRKTRKNSQYFHPASKRSMNRQIDNVSNFIEQNYLQNNKHIDLRQEIMNSLSKTGLQKEYCKSPRLNTDDMFERSKGISSKTQELLNKSYWEYYNKLRHKIQNTNSIEQQYPYNLTMDAAEKGKQRKVNEIHDKELRSQLKINPEIQTLQQCTVLSTMINKALDSNLKSNVQTKQLYINDNMKTSSNHIVDAQNSNTKKISHLVNDEPKFNKVKRNADKTNDKQFLELKSIIFFGGMMYILIIFLPMLYDYFYYDEYDDYENLSYLELVVEYILSSFKEAFGGIFDGVKQIFFYPVRLRTKL
ncbi:hypothetical protein WN51_08608 [Melipona quadrifasciata]|uniref:Uncharacterized protein n=1 Tax=Melipona quadrifasciata TaxID=166423 RepID=A0A0M9A9X5_9HYME|nr:hypothetical protein WN51_08608 [Melipona quadrifasciata]